MAPFVKTLFVGQNLPDKEFHDLLAASSIISFAGQVACMRNHRAPIARQLTAFIPVKAITSFEIKAPSLHHYDADFVGYKVPCRCRCLFLNAVFLQAGVEPAKAWV